MSAAVGAVVSGGVRGVGRQCGLCGEQGGGECRGGDGSVDCVVSAGVVKG